MYLPTWGVHLSVSCPFAFHTVHGLPWWLRWLSICLQCRRPGFDSWVGKIPCRRKWQFTPVLLLGKSHGQRSLVGYSPWGCKELNTTERLHFHFHFSYCSWVLKARILKWFAVPFSSGPHCIRPLHHHPPVLGGPTQDGLVSLS